MKTKTQTTTLQKKTAINKINKATNVKKKARPSAKKAPVMKSKTTTSTEQLTLPNLSSGNIAKLLSNFMTFRSMVKDMNGALNRLESFMDSTFSMFKIAQQMTVHSKRQKNPFSFLLGSSPEKKSNTDDDEDIPIIKFPGENRKTASKSTASPMMGNLMGNIDINQIFKMMQSPLFQKMLSGLLRGSTAASTSSLQNKEEQK